MEDLFNCPPLKGSGVPPTTNERILFMNYVELFIGVLFTVAGVVFGFLIVLQIVHVSKKKKTKYGQRTYHKENEKAYSKHFLQDEDKVSDEINVVEESIHYQEPENKGLLKRRLGKEKESWTQFNCDCDEKDMRSHIESSRKKEDQAYCFIKNRNKENSRR